MPMFILALYLYLVKLWSKQWRLLMINENNPIKVGHAAGSINVLSMSYWNPEKILTFQQNSKNKAIYK